MKQYLDLLGNIKENGTLKPAARENMPSTTSLFGYQFRHDLSKGFPLLTTKKMYWKGVVFELLWFLKGDYNIKYLIDNKVTKLWTEDAYNYYVKIAKGNTVSDANGIYHKNEDGSFRMLLFNEFLEKIKITPKKDLPTFKDYTLGDCGYQYGKVWRAWDKYEETEWGVQYSAIDQIHNVIAGLRKSPQGRRHLVTAIYPAHDTELAIYWCHALFQFNCRPMSFRERKDEYMLGKNKYNHPYDHTTISETVDEWIEVMNKPEVNVPKFKLDCHLYQRSADVILGVPFNIASYALLTEIIAKMCNMVAGDFIHSFGDVHIYENHAAAVDEQLSRTPSKLPTLDLCGKSETVFQTPMEDIDFVLSNLEFSDFTLLDYIPQSKIEAELSTGMKK